MKKGNNFSFVKMALIVASLFLFGSVSNGQTISFNQSALDFKDFEKIANGTSLKFGPDKRLYVAQLKGEIKIYTIKQENPNAYFVSSEETILNVKNIPNYDDNGKLAFDKRVGRQITGITVVGTPANPVIYVGSSDPKWGGPSGDKLLDTNSGIITKLTWTGSKWDAIDLVRGLPRSEENHSLNGLEFTMIKGKPYLLVTSGGFTNAGAPSKNFTYITEFALSGAILSVDLNAIDALPTKIDAYSKRPFKYDIPTLDDPSRANANGIYDPNDPNYNGIDVNDPFGGNDGLNMAMVTTNGPVQVFSPGYRNTYDLVVTENNRLYATDNGANVNWGGLPNNEGNANTVNNNYNPAEPGGNPSTPSPSGEYVDNEDHLLMVSNNLENYTFGSFYAGHPTPIRANPGNPYPKGNSFPFNPGGAGLYTKFVGDNDNWKNVTPDFTPTDKFRTQILKPIAPGQPGFDNYAANSLPANWPPVPLSKANPAEADFIAPSLNNPNGPQPEIITLLPVNSNGIDEYKASNFNGALKGALVIGKNKGDLHLIHLNANGSLKKAEFGKWKLNGGNALGITCNSDEEIFPGTIWVATFDNRIMVLTPEDDFFCLDQSHPDFDPLADYDHDGYTNQDEIDNGTDYCSGGSIPEDYDKDFVSNLNDLDDDGDGILDENDPFQLGNPNNLPINNELFSNQTDPQGREYGYLGLGLTGLMNNGAPNPNWLNWLEKENSPGPRDIYGGAAGAIQVSMTGGTANGKSNNQEKGFQFGVNVGAETGIFTITSGLIGLSSPGQLYGFNGNGEIGIQLGDGTQSNFIKLVFTAEGILAGQEINDVEDTSPLFLAIPNHMRPGSNTLIQLSFEVDPANGTVKPFYKFGNASPVPLGTINAAGKIKDAIQKMSVPLAIGIYGTSNDFSKSFIGVWNFFKVDGESPFSKMDLVDLVKNLNSPEESLDLQEYFGDNGGTNNLSFAIVKNTNTQIGAKIENKILKVSFPSNPAISEITVRATNTKGLYYDQSFVVKVGSESQEVLIRINAGGPALPGGAIGPDWLADNVAGSFSSSSFSVNNGRLYSGNSSADIRHSSIPEYISAQTFGELFKMEKFSTESEMEYSIPLANGEYLVNLYMGNGFPGTSEPLNRLFDIEIEDELVADKFDLIQQFGHKVGGKMQYKVNVADGELNIKFLKQKENPLVNAIEILGNSPMSSITYTPIKDQIDFPGKVLDGSFVIQASGGTGNLNYAATGLPPGISLEPTNGTVYGKIEDNAYVGSPYNVTVTISDSNPSNTTTFHFKWTVSQGLNMQKWTVKKEATNYTGRHENSLVQAGDKFYLMGGRENSKTIDVYDYQNDKWTNLENISPESFNHFQATEYHGFIWVIGAFKDNNFPAEKPAENVWMFDPAHETWIKGPEIPVSRRRGSAGLVQYKDKFYVVGGNTNGHSGGYVNFFDEYDPKTGQWKVLTNAPRARDHFFATVIGDNLYVASGRLSGGDGGVFAPVIPEVDVYNFITQKWSTLSADKNLPTPRAGAIVNNYLDKLIVAGGESMASSNALSVTEAFDPVTQKWEQLAPLNFARHGTQGIVSGKGLYVLGGSPKRGGGNQKNQEYFGFDEPQGTKLVPGKVIGPNTVNLVKETPQKVDISVGEGNMGIWVKSIGLVGSNSQMFSMTSGNIGNMLFWPNGHVHELEFLYNGSIANAQAQIEVVYGNNLKKTITLVGNVSSDSDSGSDSGIGNGNSGTTEVGIYYNAGSSTDLEMLGNNYLGDENHSGLFSSGTIYVNEQSSVHPLFHTERFSPKMTYKIPVPNGTYTVVTHHTELYFGVPGGGAKGGPGKRVFDISIEGNLVKHNLDLFLENNNQPVSLVFENIEVNDGILDLNLVSTVNNATIAGFGIFNEATGIGSLPEANITASKTTGPAALEVIFDNTSEASASGYAYSWDFGDGNSSSVKNPTHIFSKEGTYTVKLQVRDGQGKIGTDEVVITVTKPTVSKFELFINGGSNLTTNYMGGFFAGESNTHFSFTTSNTYSIEPIDVPVLFSTERYGKDYTYSVPLANGTYTVKTYHNELYFGIKGPAAKAGNRVFDIYLEGTLVKGDFDIFTEGNNQPTIMTFQEVEVNDGVLNLRLIAKANNASISGISIHSLEGIQNIGLPEAILQADVLKGPSPLTVQFTGSSSTGAGGLSYLWDFGNGKTSTLTNPKFVFEDQGQYEVTLTVTDFYGNKDVENTTINVLADNSGSNVLWSLNLNTGANVNTTFEGSQYLGDVAFPGFYNQTKTNVKYEASELEIFQTERYGANMIYSIPVDNGNYRVKTLHNELYFGHNGPAAKAGNRVFDILIEGKLVKDDFDLFVESKNQPVVLVFDNITVSDGVLNIQMVSSANNASISGLVIEHIEGTGNSNARIMGNEELEVFAQESTAKKLPIVHIYPNPASQEAFIRLDEDLPLDLILVHDFSGKQVFEMDASNATNPLYVLPVDRFGQGVYLVTLIGKNGQMHQLRLVVKR